MRKLFPLFLLVALPATAQQPVITDFNTNGFVTWANPDTNAFFTTHKRLGQAHDRERSLKLDGLAASCAWALAAGMIDHRPAYQVLYQYDIDGGHQKEGRDPAIRIFKACFGSVDYAWDMCQRTGRSDIEPK